MMNSQPPPSASPSTAATVGTIEYLSICVVTWNCSTRCSTSASLPAISWSATPSWRAAFSASDSASRLKFLNSLPSAEGGAGGALEPLPLVFFRLAPTENGGSVCQITRPA